MARRKSNPKVGRPRSYASGAELKSAVEKYFNSISYLRKVEERVPVTEEIDGEQVPKLDAKGHIMKKIVPVITMDGKEAEVLCWTEPPSIENLQVFLGISKSTWANYAQQEEFMEAVTHARGRVEAYLATVGLKDPKTARAAEFNLMHNFGWKQEKKVEVSGNVEEYLKKLDEEGRGQEM